MAEQKIYEEYQESPSMANSQPKVEQQVVLPTKKLKKISKAEKLIVLGILVLFLALAVLTVKVTTTISKEEDEISEIQQDIQIKKNEADKLAQEKNELSQVERIKAAAKKGNLELHDDNIRKVTK